jgi:hypothetical protein
VVSKVGEQCVVGFPPVGEFGPDAEVNRLVGGMGVENVGYPGTGDDDAGVAVPGGQYAQAASLQVEDSGVTPLCVPKTSSTSCDQAVFVDQATGAGLPSYAVPGEIDRFG